MTISNICNIVLYGTGITISDILSESQNGTVCDQRHMCIYFVRTFLKSVDGRGKFGPIPWSQIEVAFNRDHSTCISSYKKVKSLMAYSAYKSRIEFLTRKIDMLIKFEENLNRQSPVTEQTAVLTNVMHGNSHFTLN
jgi:chromosomal replication initiation ATPase DnaA